MSDSFALQPDMRADERDDDPLGDLNDEPTPRRCAVCGGLNPGDVTHSRCTTTGYEGLD